MDTIEFTKMSGAGNDFIVIDNRGGKIPEAGRSELFAKWCRRRLDVGADGVLLVEPPISPDAHFRMRYHNADGGEAESCGNGARCIARFAHRIGAAPESMIFDTEAGLYRASHAGDEIILEMSDPHSLRRDIDLGLPEIAGGAADFINTGVPHAVCFVENVEAVDVDRLGSRIRYHEAFAPAGANVNFVQRLAGGELRARTYERGVEAETLACGTGCVAAAMMACLRGEADSPVSIVTGGGSTLRVHFERGDGGFTKVKLEGEARFVYEGVLTGSPLASVSPA